MAVTAKTWSAIIYRPWTSLNPLTFETVLEYNQHQTSPEEIAGLYPSLSWDRAVGYAPGELRFNWLPQCYRTPAEAGYYASDEEAMLDLQNWVESPDGNGLYRGSFGKVNFYIRYKDGAWLTSLATGEGTTAYPGSPATVWAQYPDANTYNITTPAPFGTGLGNGLIRAQALYYHPEWRNSTSGPVIGSQFPSPPVPAVTDSGNIAIGVVDVTFIFTPLEDTGNSSIDGGGDGSNSSSLTIRSWGFSLDGHDFYVLRLGSSGTFVYDLTTDTWSEWITPGRTNWRPHIGQNWIGLANISTDAGQTDVFCGDDATGTLWQLNTLTGRDERDTAGTIWPDDKITKVVTGGIQTSGRTATPCGAVELDLALGNPTQTGAFVQLEISDDLGQTWTDCGTITVTSGDYSTPVEWTGLGLITQPGRLFRITDDGATVRIGGANMRSSP